MISCHNSHLYIWKRFSFTHTPSCTRSKHPSFKTEWVTLLFTIFQIPSQVFGLAGCSTFSLAITGLLGFSNGPFEETTLLSQANGGGGRRHLASSQSHGLSSSSIWRVWRWKSPQNLWEWRKRCTHTLFLWFWSTVSFAVMEYEHNFFFSVETKTKIPVFTWLLPPAFNTNLNALTTRGSLLVVPNNLFNI